MPSKKYRSKKGGKKTKCENPIALKKVSNSEEVAERLGCPHEDDTPFNFEDVPDTTELLVFCEAIEPRLQGIAVKTTHGDVLEMMKTYENQEDIYKIIKSSDYPDDNPDLPQGDWIGLGVVRKKEVLDGYLASMKSNILLPQQEIIDMPLDSQEWRDWCNDVVLYLCLRNKLYNEPIPMCPLAMVEGGEDLSRAINSDCSL